jgi:biopolymer transport protein ExbD
MGMNVGSSGGDEAAISVINTTPLVDVMLVLLIIFLITIPVITQTVKLDLPKVYNEPTKTKPENINLSIDKDGQVFWNAGLVKDDETLVNKLRAIAVMNPQPEVHVRADTEARYEYVGKSILLVQRQGIRKVGFLTEPDKGMRSAR